MSPLQHPLELAVVDDAVLELPASTEHLRTVRLLVSAIATLHSGDLDDLEDLRIAAGELCAHVIDGVSEDARLKVVVEVFGQVDSVDSESRAAGRCTCARFLVMEASVDGPIPIEDFDTISSMVMSAASDGFGAGSRPTTYDMNATAQEHEILGRSHSAWFRRQIRAAGRDQARQD